MSIGRAKFLFNFTMALNWKRVHLYYSLFNLLVKNSFGGKITYNLYFFMGRKAFFIFPCEEKRFAEFWIAVSFFALEAIVERCSAKVGVLQNAILKCSSSDPLVKIFEDVQALNPELYWKMIFFTTIFQGLRLQVQSSYFKGQHLMDICIASINDFDFFK